MNIRNFKIEDFGFCKQDYANCIEYINSNAFSEVDMLLECCHKANKNTVIADSIFYALINNLSLESIEMKKGTIPLNKVDFYAYRRLSVVFFMQKTEQWKVHTKEQ